MSGELADCFENKMDGISFIVDAVKNALSDARFYGTEGKFHDHAVPLLAAANWLASADYLRERYPGAVLLDIGSTTADIIQSEANTAPVATGTNLHQLIQDAGFVLVLPFPDSSDQGIAADVVPRQPFLFQHAADPAC